MADGLLDWLSGSLGLGGSSGGGTPMQPGPGSMMGGMDPMGYPTGQMEPMPTAAPAATLPMMPVQPDNMDPANRGMTPPIEQPPMMNATPINRPPRPAPSNMDPMAAGGIADSGTMDPMGAGMGPPPAAPPVPMPQARPPGAPGLPPTDVSAAAPAPGPGPGTADVVSSYMKAGGNFAPPGEQPGAPGGGSAKGILESALGLSPERATRVRGNLGAGLKSVAENSSKPGLAAFAGSAGAGIEGGTKSDEKQTDQRIKSLNSMIAAQGSGDRAAYTKALTDYTKAKMENEKIKAADPAAAAKSKSVMTEEQKLFKVADTLAKHPQITAARHGLEAAQRSGSAKQVAAAQKVFDDLYNKTKTDLTESLRPGSKQNAYKVTNQAELEKVAKPGDVYINPADGNPYIFKGAKKADAAPAAAAATPAAAAGLPEPGTLTPPAAEE